MPRFIARRIGWSLGAALLASLVLSSAAIYRYTHPLPRPSTRTAAAPASLITTSAPQPPWQPAPRELIDLLRIGNPRYPTTRPLDEPLDLKYADHIVLSEAVHLDTQGHLWITTPAAGKSFDFASAAQSRSATHLVRDRVALVQWTPDHRGVWMPRLVVRNPAGAGFELVDQTRRRHLPDAGFDWARAMIVTPAGAGQWIIVPTDRGVRAFRFEQSPQEILQSHFSLAGEKPGDVRVQLCVDLQGVLAWVTDSTGRRGKPGVARLRFSQEDSSPGKPRWSRLTAAAGWPDNILHLVPLLDGSVLQIISAGTDDKVGFSINMLEAAAVDELRILKLVDGLAAADQAARDQAMRQLMQYGPGIAPLLEKAMEDAPPEAQIRLRQWLQNRIEPTLGGMSLMDGHMRLVERFADGGVLFFAEAGVSIPRPGETPQYVAPAWLMIRPGRPVELVPPALAAELGPGRSRLTILGNEMIVVDPAQGPQRFVGNRLLPMLRRNEQQFARFVGIDAGGRWIFNDCTSPARSPATSMTTQDIEVNSPHAADAPRTLIIDPRLPDRTPRLPAWLLPPSSKAGWDRHGWPVIYMASGPPGAAWALGELGWRLLDPRETVYGDAPAAQPESGEQPLLTMSDGRRLFDGRKTLRILGPGDRQVIWQLPDRAVGTGRVALLEARDGLLFLFNEPGRIVRLRPLPDGSEPLEVDAVFTRGVPDDPAPRRIWLDPAGRICILHDKSRVTVLFPNGRIPAAIAEKIPVEQSPKDE